MYWQLESMGIEPSEAWVEGLLRAALQEGKAYRAYTKGWTYINHWFGSMQLSAHVREPHDGRKGEVFGSNLHAAGSFPYQLKVITTLASTDRDDPLERRILAQTVSDEESTLVVNIVNADRLPCWKDGTVVTVQMIAKALSLNVYKDEDEYREKTSFPVSRKEINDGKEFQLTAAVGSVLPEGFLGLHMIRDGQEPEPEPEDLLEESRMVLTGRVESTFERQEMNLP